MAIKTISSSSLLRVSELLLQVPLFEERKFYTIDFASLPPPSSFTKIQMYSAKKENERLSKLIRSFSRRRPTHSVEVRPIFQNEVTHSAEEEDDGYNLSIFERDQRWEQGVEEKARSKNTDTISSSSSTHHRRDAVYANVELRQ